MVAMTGVFVGRLPTGRGVTVGGSTISTSPGVGVGASGAGGTTGTWIVGTLPTTGRVGVPRSATLVAVARSAASAAASSGGIAARPGGRSQGL